MSRPTTQIEIRKPVVSVHVHTSPTQATPRIRPTSPDTIAAFDYTQLDSAGSYPKKENKSLKKAKNPSNPKSKVAADNARKLRINHLDSKQQKIVDSRLPHAGEIKIPLPLHKLKTSTVRKSATLTNIGREVSNPNGQRRMVHSSRNFDKTKGDDRVVKSFFNNELPPYNPTDFVPAPDGSDEVNSQLAKTQTSKLNSNQELVKKIRLELNEWMVKSAYCEKKKKCPEQWSSLPVECHPPLVVMGEDLYIPNQISSPTTMADFSLLITPYPTAIK